MFVLVCVCACVIAFFRWCNAHVCGVNIRVCEFVCVCMCVYVCVCMCEGVLSWLQCIAPTNPHTHEFTWFIFFVPTPPTTFSHQDVKHCTKCGTGTRKATPVTCKKWSFFFFWGSWQFRPQIYRFKFHLELLMKLQYLPPPSH